MRCIRNGFFSILRAGRTSLRFVLPGPSLTPRNIWCSIGPAKIRSRNLRPAFGRHFPQVPYQTAEEALLRSRWLPRRSRCNTFASDDAIVKHLRYAWPRRSKKLSGLRDPRDLSWHDHSRWEVSRFDSPHARPGSNCDVLLFG